MLCSSAKSSGSGSSAGWSGWSWISVDTRFKMASTYRKQTLLIKPDVVPDGQNLPPRITHLFLGHDGGAVVQRVAQHVAAHALARLVVKVLEERRKVFELEDRQDVVVGVHGDLQQSGQLLGHRAAGRDAAEGKKVARLGSF